MNIAIIGGGIGGLTTAIALNQKGITSTIFEKSQSFNTNGAGLALWPNATSILDKLGLLNTINSNSTKLNSIVTKTSSGKILNQVNLNKLEDKFNFPSLVLLRYELLKELANKIPTSQIQFNKDCIAIEKFAQTLLLKFRDGTTEKVNAVIFADGIHSFARKNIFNLRPLQYAGRCSWRGIAQFNTSLSLDNTSYEIFGVGKRIGIFPLPNNRVYWYAAVNMPEEEFRKQIRSISCVQSHFKNWPELVDIIFNNTTEDKLILTNILYTDENTKMAIGNIALLGDAAHPMTPDLGQGACQAIEDAYTIAACLSSSSTIENAFQLYEQSRLCRVKQIAKDSFRIGKLRQLENPIGILIRNNFLKIVPERFVLQMLEKNIRTEI